MSSVSSDRELSPQIASEGPVPAAPASAGLDPALLALGAALLLGGYRLLLGDEKIGYQGVWDDAYMFVRYADRLLAEGRLAWNPGGAPTWGATSLAYVGVVALVRLASRHNAWATALGASLLSTGIFLALARRLLHRLLASSSPAGQLLGRRYLWCALAFTVPSLAGLAVSGMDTPFALAYLCAYLIAAHSFSEDATPRRALICGGMGGLALLVRPDLLAFTLPTQLALLVWSEPGPRRARAGGALALTITVIALTLGWARVYFGHPLPLPFYAKSLGLYADEPNLLRAFGPLAALSAGELLALSALLWLPLLVSLRHGPVRWWRRSLPLERGLLVGVAGFFGYYLFIPLQVMHFYQRFYFPLLPALLVLSALALRRGGGPSSPRLPDGLVAALAAFLSIAAHLPLASEALAMVARFQGVGARPFVANEEAIYHARFERTWFRLDQLVQLPELSIATTEVGLASVLAPTTRIIDLAGLNEPRFALQPLDPGVLLDELRPDVIYLPLGDYQAMIERIMQHPSFRELYDFYPTEECRCYMPIAVRRDSPHYPAMHHVLRDLRAASL